ncbi:unnamed protein product [Rotaria magnacalcarata]|uniref:Uncharacterized protein n=2 Tax=Rotaria magnacalcarata TaxID=392030 RepID=A0A8S2NG40_9BILA|nr:unnamed protein product [Rotaria magnacalcarata]
MRTLNCGALALRGNLSLAVDKINTIHRVVDETVVHLVQAIAEWKNKIKQSQKDLSALHAQIKSVQKQVAIAEQGVKDKQAGVNSTNDAGRGAKRAMEDAVNCQRRRGRRKRLFFNPSRVFKPFCSVFRQNGIENAMKRSIDANAQIESARNQLCVYENRLHNFRAQQEELKSQMTDGITELVTPNSTLSEFKIQQRIIMHISEQLKKAILHIEKA